MVGEPKGNEYEALRRAGQALGVSVSRMPVADYHFRTIGPLIALETWRGLRTNDLRDVHFPDTEVTIIMGTTNAGLDPQWREVIFGSIYIGTNGLLSAPVAGAILMYEWTRQRERV